MIRPLDVLQKAQALLATAPHPNAPGWLHDPGNCPDCETEADYAWAMKRLSDQLIAAWGVIANVDGGDWSKQSNMWQDAAHRWGVETGFRQPAPEDGIGIKVAASAKVADARDLKRASARS